MTNSEKAQILEARIRILTDKIHEQSATFDKMQNKMFALVGLVLTLGGLLTYDAFKIHFPKTVLEYIVFVTALILIGITAILIGHDYRAKKNWLVPIGPVEEIKLDNAKNYDEALEIIHMDYIDVYHDRNKKLDHKAKFLNTSLYAFIMSVILLIILKIGG